LHRYKGPALIFRLYYREAPSSLLTFEGKLDEAYLPQLGMINDQKSEGQFVHPKQNPTNEVPPHLDSHVLQVLLVVLSLSSCYLFYLYSLIRIDWRNFTCGFKIVLSLEFRFIVCNFLFELVLYFFRHKSANHQVTNSIQKIHAHKGYNLCRIVELFSGSCAFKGSIRVDTPKHKYK
jgi:hypothetical protein